MEALSQLPLPLGSAIGAGVWLLVWLIRRGDTQTKSVVEELRRQRDEAIARADHLQTQVDRLRVRLLDTDPRGLIDLNGPDDRE